jgi:hypothetical protein
LDGLLARGWEGKLTQRRDPATVDAYVDGDRTPISSHLSGYVRAVLVRGNQSVRAGETILGMSTTITPPWRRRRPRRKAVIGKAPPLVADDALLNTHLSDRTRATVFATCARS